MNKRDGILLVNTGSPDSPEKEDVKRYLNEFLMDPHVMDIPLPLRALLVHAIILPRRPAQSAEAYKEIWTEKGSPLVYYCAELARKLTMEMNMPVEVGMAYGNPSISDGIKRLEQQGIEKLHILPLFPQYATATIGACISQVRSTYYKPFEVIPPFYAHEAFIKPLAERLINADEHILFSYHGLPVRHLQKTDPTKNHCMCLTDCCSIPSPAHATCYRHQCQQTTAAIVRASGISEEQFTVSFQSRLGRAKWMEPYTEEVLQKLPKQDVKKIAVLCPAFFCDCLETLEEIGIRGKETFIEAGGESFRLIPCLNSEAEAVACLAKICDDYFSA